MAKKDQATTQTSETDETLATKGVDAVVPFEGPPAGWDEESIGFPPYWGPDEEALAQGQAQGFYARVIAFDGADPAFPRFIMQAGRNMLCHRGAVEAQEEVVVRKGEFFTCSAYSGLPLEKYIGIPVYVLAKGKRKIVTTKGERRTPWDWSLRVSPEAKRVLEARRLAAANAAVAMGLASRQAPGLQGGNGAAPQLGGGGRTDLIEEIPF